MVLKCQLNSLVLIIFMGANQLHVYCTSKLTMVSLQIIKAQSPISNCACIMVVLMQHKLSRIRYVMEDTRAALCMQRSSQI